MSSLQFFRVRCTACGSKFCISSDMTCKHCAFLGVPCSHIQLCLKCHRNRLFDSRVFFSTVGVIILVVTHSLGGRI